MYTIASTLFRMRKTILTFSILAFSINALAQMEESALDHLLQRRTIAKKYEDKSFMDHLFLEVGAGVNTTLVGKNKVPGLETPGVQVGGALGDWVTPNHGWRINANASTRVLGQRKSKTLGISADYMLNITSISQPKYSIPRNWEFIATAGLGFSLAHYHTDTRKALDAHIGLRAQRNIHDYTYLYLEPQVGVVSDGLYNLSTWRRYRLAGMVNAGLGYRLVPETRSKTHFEGNKYFLDNTFAEIAGGPSFLLTSSPSNWGSTLGGRIQASVGKWWDPYSATRISAGVGLHRRDGKAKNKSINVSLGYMLNMHNAFGGYDPTRKYWVNALVDVSGNVSASGNGKHFSPGIGAGLQANVSVGKHNTLFLEPRMDLIQGDYILGHTTVRNWDLMPSLYAGINFMGQGDFKTVHARNHEFHSPYAHNHLFMEASLGATLPVTGHNLSHVNGHARPKINLALGKWFHPTSGVRLWSEATQYVTPNARRYRSIALGADYLWHITNTMLGYEPGHRFEMIAAAGINTAVRQGRIKPYFGGNFGLRAQWNTNKMWGFFLEQQFRIYDDQFLPSSQFSHFDVDVVSALSAGVQINMRDYVPSVNREKFMKDAKRSFFSLAGGFETSAIGLRTRSQYGPIGKLSFGKWFNPVSAWRININGFEKQNNGRRYARIMAGADYMLDLSHLGMGYNPDRSVSLRGVAGLDLGTDLQRRSKAHFLAELHGGAQLAVKAGKNCEIYLEPQLAYEMSNKDYSGRIKHINARAYAGLNWKLNTTDGSSRKGAAPERNQFISFGLGTGLHTGTFNGPMPARRRLNTDVAASYGQWYNAVSGWSAGMKNTTVITNGRGNANIMSLHADYLFNLITIAGGQAQINNPWTLNGYIGASLNIAHRPFLDTRVTPGLRAGLQFGHNIGDKWNIYLEPHASITSKRIWVGSTHPADGQVGLMLGTKYRF